MFAPWCAEATCCVYNYARFDAPGMLDVARPVRRHELLRPADGVADADPGRPAAACDRPPREVVGAGEPLNPEVIEQVRAGVGRDASATASARPRPRVQIAQHAGPAGQAGLHGPPAARLPVELVDPATGRGRRTRARSAWTSTARPARADGRLPRRRPALTAEAIAGGYYHTGDVASRDARRLHHLRRPRRRRVQGQRLPDLPVRAGERADRAPGGRRGGGGARPGPAAAGRAQGVRRARRRLPSPTPETAPVASCAFAREHLAPYQRIRRLEFAELPKTISGKIRRVELRGRESARSDRSGTLGGVHTVGLPLLTRGNAARDSRRRQWTEGAPGHGARGCGTRGTMVGDQDGDGTAAVPMAEVMAEMPGVWRRLLAAHVPDRFGRCSACRSATGSGRSGRAACTGSRPRPGSCTSRTWRRRSTRTATPDCTPCPVLPGPRRDPPGPTTPVASAG